MKNEVLLSCPFCGSEKEQVCRTNKYACWIRCDSCCADAKNAPTRAGAIRNWNKRFYPSTATIVEDDDIEWKEYHKNNKEVINNAGKE